jgi:riboflavin biosynthesis pyrimidine reductase
VLTAAAALLLHLDLYPACHTQVFWECGGTLAAPAIAGGIIHKLMAFVAPKIIGGTRAPTPVGELGNVEMTQAVNLVEPRWEQVRVWWQDTFRCFIFSYQSRM